MIEPSFDLSVVSWAELDVPAEVDMADLIAAWAVHHEQGTVGGPHFWAWEAGDHLASHYPAQALGFVMATLALAPSDSVLSNLAAGPLEDLLVRNGDAVIATVERLARAEPAFRALLGGVWKNAIADAVWERVQLARAGSPSW